MSVRWPDGSLTGSVRVDETTAPAPVETAPKTHAPAVEPEDKKEVKDGAR